MNEKQRRFADEYIRTGNISESYRLAYQNVKKETTASVNGSRLLKNAKVKSYIDKRLDELKKESIAEQDEVLQYLTSVMRGQQTEKTLRGAGDGLQVIDDIDVDAAKRIKAAELLGKRYGIWTDKQEIDVTGAVQFVDDIGDEDES